MTDQADPLLPGETDETLENATVEFDELDRILAAERRLRRRNRKKLEALKGIEDIAALHDWFTERELTGPFVVRLDEYELAETETADFEYPFTTAGVEESIRMSVAEVLFALSKIILDDDRFNPDPYDFHSIEIAWHPASRRVVYDVLESTEVAKTYKGADDLSEDLLVSIGEIMTRHRLSELRATFYGHGDEGTIEWHHEEADEDPHAFPQEVPEQTLEQDLEVIEDQLEEEIPVDWVNNAGGQGHYTFGPPQTLGGPATITDKDVEYNEDDAEVVYRQIIHY